MIIEKEGLKDFEGKERIELIMPNSIIGMAEVLTMGAEKYKANSWQNVKDPLDTHYASLMRHVIAWRKGEKLDSESKLHHMKHVLTNAMFLLDHDENNRK